MEVNVGSLQENKKISLIPLRGRCLEESSDQYCTTEGVDSFDELYNIFKNLNTVQVIKASIIHTAGYINRWNDSNQVKMIQFCKLYSRIGKPRLGVEKDLKHLSIKKLKSADG